MTQETTARHGLPLIAPGQAQKEVSHNEALAAIDMIVQPAVTAVGTTVPPVSPTPGECWVLGAVPTGAWSGHAQAVACWTANGWRFVAAREGMCVWTGGTSGVARYVGGTWITGALVGATVSLAGNQVVGARQASIVAPSGGSVVDTEARTAIGSILSALRTHGLIAT